MTSNAIDTTAHDLEPTAEDVSKAVALIRPDDEWGDIDDGDLTPKTGPVSIPMLGLNRKLDGGFTLPDTGEVVRELDVVLLAKQNTRAWFAAPFGTKDAGHVPDCWSADTVTPDERSPKVMNDVCATCPMAEWDDGDPPKCKESIVTMAFMPDPGGSGRFVRIRWGGIAFAPIRDYWESFRNRVPRRPPMAYVTHVELVETVTSNGTFLTPKFTRGRDIARAELAPVIHERDARLGEFRELTAGDAQQGDGNGEQPPEFETAAPVSDALGQPF